MSQDATTKAISAQTGYYTCGTSAGTAAKVVTVESGNLYKRTLGGHFKVKMTNANTAASGVTLKIGSETAAPLLYNGEAVSASNTWKEGEVIFVYFDGTNYQASNAQGGGGKAEKIKYDNSQSGLAATDVQGALDEINHNVVDESTVDYTDDATWEEGTISNTTGEDMPSDAAQRSSAITARRFLTCTLTSSAASSTPKAVKLYRDNTFIGSEFLTSGVSKDISSYNANKLRFVVADETIRNNTISCTVQTLVKDIALSNYDKVKEMTQDVLVDAKVSLVVSKKGHIYPSKAWNLEPNTEYRIKIIPQTTPTANIGIYFHENADGTGAYGGGFTLSPSNTSIDSVFTTGDTGYQYTDILSVENVSNAVSIYIYKSEDVPFSELSKVVNGNDTFLTYGCTAVGTRKSTSNTYYYSPTVTPCSKNGIIKSISGTWNAAGVCTFYIASIGGSGSLNIRRIFSHAVVQGTNTLDISSEGIRIYEGEYLFINFDDGGSHPNYELATYNGMYADMTMVCELRTDLTVSLSWVVQSHQMSASEMSDVLSSKSHEGLSRLNVKYIKSDGSGDYTSIQSAINAIADATEYNQYELRVCDDESYTAATELWLVSKPSTHASSDTTPAVCAAIVTKNYINIVGWNRKRKVSVRLSSIGVGYVKNVVAMHLQGNVVIDNMDFEVENCRYAIHQESGGNKKSPDYHATTVLKNSNVIHLGGSLCTSWTSTYGQANGACDGLTCIYENVFWYPGYYMHGNSNFDAPMTAKFYNCTIAHDAAPNILSPRLGVPYISNLGSGHPVRLHVEGCTMIGMYGRTEMYIGNTVSVPMHDYRTQIPIVSGNGNCPMLLMPLKPQVLAVKTASINSNVSSVSGTAASDIFGEVWKSYNGTADKYGVLIGSESIQYVANNYAYTLAYRLGDCSSTPKTLVISAEGTVETVTLAKNFKTNYSTWSDAAIVAYINNQLTHSIVVLAKTDSDFWTTDPWEDCREMVVNSDTRTMMFGMAVRRSLGNQWVLCDTGDTPEGVVCERINPSGYGKVALIGKNIFTDLYGVNATAGNRVSPADAGAWAVVSNGLLKAISNNAYQVSGND